MALEPNSTRRAATRRADCAPSSTSWFQRPRDQLRRGVRPCSPVVPVTVAAVLPLQTTVKRWPVRAFSRPPLALESRLTGGPPSPSPSISPTRTFCLGPLSLSTTGRRRRLLPKPGADALVGPFAGDEYPPVNYSLMAANTGESLGVERLLSYADDLMGVLCVSTDRDGNAQVSAGAQRLLSGSRSESDNLEMQLKEYQEKIDSCKEKIDKAKAETISDDELNALQRKTEEVLHEEKQLRQELRVLHDELDGLDRQSVSIKERKDAVKKKKKDMQKAERLLSMCVSVTNIVPNLEDQDKVSGYIVDKNRKKIEKFEFENKVPPVEICNELWKKI